MWDVDLLYLGVVSMGQEEEKVDAGRADALNNVDINDTNFF